MKFCLPRSIVLLVGKGAVRGVTTLVSEKGCNFIGKGVKIRNRLEMSMSSFAPSATNEMNFIQRLNPTNGKTEWIEIPPNYDFHQEIARSAFADMLHDHDRNMKYFEAMRIAVATKHKAGEKAIVLDIGTGSGLLSMMAAVSGADVIYACEAFLPMAECAVNVLRRNHFYEKVKLIPKRSTDLEVGEGKDMLTRANILITEVFDTELIGEGAIRTFNHAHNNLLSEDCIVIPQKAILYAMIVDCPLVPQWNNIFPIPVSENVKLRFPEKIAQCSGVPSVQDVQLSEIKPSEFTTLTEVIPVFEFDWNCHTKNIPNERSSQSKLKVINSGTVNCVFTWWDLEMDLEAKHIISCRPSWMKGENVAWRDHWMQSVYYMSELSKVKKDEEYCLDSFHDEYSFWFKFSKTNNTQILPLAVLEHPVCECGVHTTLSRSHIAMINDPVRNANFVQVLRKVIVPEQSVCLCISDGSVLPLMAAALGAKRVFVIEMNSSCARVIQEFIACNNMQDKITVLRKDAEDLTEKEFDNLKIDIVVGDPFFQTSVYPWNNLLFWYNINTLKWNLNPNCALIPYKAVMKGVAVNFDHLWKIKAPVGEACNGEFDLTDFDKLITKSAAVADCVVDVQPLWEYPGTACSSEFSLMSFDFNDAVSSASKERKSCCIEYDRKPNGVALWVDWYLSETTFVSTGPVKTSSLGELIEWDRSSKQGVYFNTYKEDKGVITCEAVFDGSSGEINFSFIN